mmetsp:Transcript_8668/g.21151  ORF Transcript_8668/g.21151 Transcript_8668/m.21151 type:complete len:119 (-) Transcript_8668:249-605(-)
MKLLRSAAAVPFRRGLGVVAVGRSPRRCRFFGSSAPANLPMKAGTPLTDLAVFKGMDAPVTKERSEYPDWVGELTKDKPGLAALRKIPNEEAELHQIQRYLKLTRRQALRQRNEESAS